MIKLSIFKFNRFAILTAFLCFLHHNLSFCRSLNDEGLALLRFKERIVSDPFGALSNWNHDVANINPCSWFGVECSHEQIVLVLNLKNLCLSGTISPHVTDLIHIKSINLRNNSLSGKIPQAMFKLRELEVLDLGFNNFSGPLPDELVDNYSLSTLLLDHNELFGSISPEIQEFKLLSGIQVDENEPSKPDDKSTSRRSISWNIAQTGITAIRRLLQSEHRWPPFFPPPQVNSPPPEVDSPPAEVNLPPPEVNSSSTSTSPSTSLSTSPSPSPSPSSSPIPSTPSVPSNATPPPRNMSGQNSTNKMVVLVASIGGAVFLFFLIGAIVLCQTDKVATVKPWVTGLSGQLQKAFVTGVPKLKRSELETACEDFSNVLGTSSIGTVYKGTLSSGVEIAVVSLTVTSAKDWSKNLEAQFRKKIDTLSKVNHKNFVNLLGFCEEEQPFTRMMVFEYAPNGTLFEHLHIKEAEHLDWPMRMRIAMGMAYCLEHMHQLKPRPLAHKNLTSSSVNLTEDYAAKISDFGLWYELSTIETEPVTESNIYSFGVILFEIITGRAPYSAGGGPSDDWAQDYLRRQQPILEMVDPMLNMFDAEQVQRISELIKMCVHPDSRRRPRMREVMARLREITEIGPDGAVPKLSPLWWAELEIMSTEAP